MMGQQGDALQVPERPKIPILNYSRAPTGKDLNVQERPKIPKAPAKRGKKVKVENDGTSDSTPGKKKRAAADKPKKGGKKAKKGSTEEKDKSSASCRYDSSLGLLTRKFVELLKDAPEGVLDLNIAATKLSVQKRRIYDITNVLEGIGLIEKKSKNNIQWKGNGMGGVEEMRAEMTVLKQTLEELNNEELLIDDYISRMQDMLRELTSQRQHSELAYVTHEDIRQLPNFAGDTLIAIKAPSGTTLEVPHPDEGMKDNKRRYEIFLKSTQGPIDVYLVSKHDEEEVEADQTQGMQTMLTPVQVKAEEGIHTDHPQDTHTMATHTLPTSTPIPTQDSSSSSSSSDRSSNSSSSAMNSLMSMLNSPDTRSTLPLTPSTLPTMSPLPGSLSSLNSLNSLNSLSSLAGLSSLNSLSALSASPFPINSPFRGSGFPSYLNSSPLMQLHNRGVTASPSTPDSLANRASVVGLAVGQDRERAAAASPLVKLEPNQDSDYFFNLEQGEGISDFYTDTFLT